MRLDADAWVAALEPPQVTLGGRTYTGRILSVVEFLPFQPHIENLPSLEPAAMLGLFTLYSRAVFPWRWSYLVTGDPVRRLMALPLGPLIEVMRGFFECQGRAMSVGDAPMIHPGSKSAASPHSPPSTLPAS